MPEAINTKELRKKAPPGPEVKTIDEVKAEQKEQKAAKKSLKKARTWFGADKSSTTFDKLSSQDKDRLLEAVGVALGFIKERS